METVDNLTKWKNYKKNTIYQDLSTQFPSYVNKRREYLYSISFNKWDN